MGPVLYGLARTVNRLGWAGPVSFRARAIIPGLGQENWHCSNTKMYFVDGRKIKCAEKR